MMTRRYITYRSVIRDVDYRLSAEKRIEISRNHNHAVLHSAGESGYVYIYADMSTYTYMYIGREQVLRVYI